MKAIQKGALIIGAALVAQAAFAQRVVVRDNIREPNDRGSLRYVLDYNNEQFTGDSKLALKSKLQQDYGVNANTLKLKRVKLFAKTKHGQGTATLKLGQDLSEDKLVDGRPRDFASDARDSYDEINFRALDDGQLRGEVLQILLHGNFKVDRVIILADESRGDNRRGWECTADGYDRRDNLQDVVGSCEQDRLDAEDAALTRCERRLDDCLISECTQKRCDGNINPRPEPRPEPRPQPIPEPRPQPKRVVGYQHVKNQCFGNNYIKVQQQCGGVGMWHGIYCTVKFSDGTSQDFHGKVDFDIDGVRVCERNARPARFNCVSSCDYTNGPFINR